MSKKDDEGSYYDKYPVIVIASDARNCFWPIMLALNENNGVRLRAMKPYLSQVSLIKDLTKRYLEEVERGEIQTISKKSRKKIDVTEVVLEFIPACRR